MRMHLIALSLLFFITSIAYGIVPANNPFKDVIIKTDTLEFKLSRNNIEIKDERHLYFSYEQSDPVCEVILVPSGYNGIESISLQSSSEFMIMDSILNMNNEFYRFKVKFANLNRAQFLNFTFQVKLEGQANSFLHEVKLFPYTLTTVKFYPPSDELFIGEEKIFELLTNNLQNIKITNEWSKGEDIDFRVSESGGQLRVHVIPNVLGNRQANIRIQTNKPYLNGKSELIHDLPVISQSFRVRASRLAFLNIEQKELTLDDDSKLTGIEVQMDNNRNLAMQKTYRVENQEEPGGALVAEIFTKSMLANDKVLCVVRPYNYHRQSDGYLYLKDGDVARFITNMNITPKTTIQSISILREGSDWTNNLNVFPGETVDLRVQGEGLHKARFRFEDVIDITPDTTLRVENMVYMRVRVPMEINKRRINLINHLTPTGQALTVKEHQNPKPFDFIFVNYGEANRRLSLVKGPIIYGKTVRDIVISFDKDRIDTDTRMYGKQILDIEIRVIGPRNELLEIRNINNVVVCPERSPRAAFYQDKSCVSEILLNTHLNRKTYDLADQSKIQIEIKHQGDKYTEPGQTKRMEIVLQKPVSFDIEVSFPAGLLTKYKGDEKFGSLGGISMAMIAQFSFAQPDRPNRYKPYKLGAGFVAFNAFNFSENAKRDVGIVALLSIYPIRREAKLTFPLFLGGGYLLTAGKPFVLLGPGIRVSF